MLIRQQPINEAISNGLRKFQMIILSHINLLYASFQGKIELNLRRLLNRYNLMYFILNEKLIITKE